LKKIKFSPDVLHANDWQAALINIYAKTIYKKDPFFKNSRCALTIHNLAYQGLFEKEKYPLLGLSWDYFNMHQLEFYGKINLLKGGIAFSDVVNTVSPTYAKQIQTPDYGCGLEGVLREKREHLCGILNAIDYTIWNPKTDTHIYKKFSVLNLEAKLENKKAFQKALGLTVNKDTLMLGMVTRLAEQKGVDILSESMEYILKKHQVVILGFGDEKYHKTLKKLAVKYKKSFSLNLTFDETLAHRIYAACDCFLMPSRFEPCGLSQMMSYKYATIPIVHHTGGLVDTVVDTSLKGGGFVFYKYSSNDLITCIERAYALFKNRKEWSALLKKVSRFNFSWEATAKKYIEMYAKL
ncbi:MAG: glycogen synthase, partial [Candidatus Omnitrophica bacterium]|nr:glycogen synthase [Candidatus Omnitrophota bacterium]